VVTPPNCDNHNDKTQFYDFIDQSIPRIPELDLVGILQIAVQFGRRYVRSLQPFG
jgi:hypothetical protein